MRSGSDDTYADKWELEQIRSHLLTDLDSLSFLCQLMIRLSQRLRVSNDRHQLLTYKRIHYVKKVSTI